MTSTQLEIPALGAAFLERYEVLEKLGEGGFGVVFKARQIATGQFVAVKVLRLQEDRTDVDFARHLSRFEREMRLSAELHHPNIIRLMDSGKGAGRVVFSVFAFLPGQNLAAVLAAEGRLEPVEARHLMSQVLDALSCAHALGVVHRDLKPENIMVIPTGARRNAVVLDFGISALSDDHWRDATRITRPNEWIGTPAYAAPEQLRGQPVLPRADLYAWGLVFLECLTGARPVDGAGLAQVVYKQLSPEPIAIPAELAATSLGRLLSRATAKDPEARDVTADGLLRELSACDVSGLALARRPSPSGLEATRADGVMGNPVTRIVGARASEGERRQVTVMCCTFAVDEGTSRGGDVDEIEPIQSGVQAECVAAAQRFGGHFAGALGDTMLFYFGYPSAQEDDAPRAARAALAMLSGVRARRAASAAAHAVGVDLRIGLHTGVIVLRDSPTGSTPGHAGGPTVKAATRLSAQAPPGTAWISGDTHRLLRGQFALETREGVGAAGAPAEVYELKEGSVEGLSDLPLVGRRRELDALLERWNRLRGGAGQAALVTGEPGIGKSRLTRALRAAIGSEPHTYLEARCEADAIDSPLHPIIEMLDRHLDPARDLASDVKVERLSALLAGHGFALEEALPLFAPLLSLPLPATCAPLAVSPPKQREMTLEAVLSLLLEMGERAPVLLLVEDLHWADPSTLELCAKIAGEVASGRVFALFTGRTEFVPPWPGSSVLSLVLGRLERGDVVQLTAVAAGGRALPDDVLERVAARTDGVPLFVEELVQTMLESGALVEQGGRLVRGPAFDVISVPTTLRDLLMARLDRLGPARETAQVAAVIGREVGVDLLRSVRGIDGEALQGDLDRLVSADLAQRKRRLKATTYVFKHALVQDTAYDSIVKGRRREIHESVARALLRDFPAQAAEQPDVLARHFERAGLDFEATGYLCLAALRAMQRSAFVEATALLTRGVDLVGRIPDASARARRELELRTLLGGALVASRGYAVPEFEANGLRAHELCGTLGDPPELFQVVFALFLLNVVRGDPPEAAGRYAAELVAIAEKAQNKDLLLSAYHARGSVLYYSQRYPEAREGLLRALSIYDPARHIELVKTFGDDHGLYAYCYLQHIEFYSGNIGQARRYIEETRALAARLRDPLVNAVAALMTMCTYHVLGDAARMKAEAEDALRIATAHGYFHWGMLARIGHGLVLARGGDVEAGLADIRAGLGYLAMNAQWTARPYWTLYLVEALRLAGRRAEALQVIDETALGTEGKLDQASIPTLLQTKADMLVEAGDRAAAIPVYRLALERAREQKVHAYALEIATSLTKTLIAEGRGEEARSCLSAAVAGIPDGAGWKAYEEASALLASMT